MNKQKGKRKSYDLKRHLSSLKRTLNSLYIGIIPKICYEKSIVNILTHFTDFLQQLGTTHKEKKKKKKLSLFTKNDFSTLDFLSSN